LIYFITIITIILDYIYCEAFLTTYRTFITPMELLRKLLYRYPLHLVVPT